MCPRPLYWPQVDSFGRGRTFCLLIECLFLLQEGDEEEGEGDEATEEFGDATGDKGEEQNGRGSASAASASSSRKGSTTIVICGICKSSSANVAWFAYLEGKPDGFLCEDCGTIVESFTGEKSEAELIAAYKHDKKITREIDEARARISGDHAPAMPSRNVLSQRVVGITLKHERAFVTEAHLVAHLGCPLKTVGLSTISLQDVENNVIVGLILRVEDLPAELPWIKVELECRTEIMRTAYTLEPQDQLRSGHAECFFNHRVSQAVNKRAGPLRVGVHGLAKTPTLQQIIAKKEAVQREREEAAEEQARRQSAIDASEGGSRAERIGDADGLERRRQSSSRLEMLDDESDAATMPPPKKPRASLTGRKSAAASGAAQVVQASATSSAGSDVDFDDSASTAGSRRGARSVIGGAGGGNASVVSRRGAASTVGGVRGPGSVVSPADKSERSKGGAGGIDIEKILGGYSPGRELGPASARLESMRPGIEKEELATMIECARAAEKWHLKSILFSPSSSLVEAWQVFGIQHCFGSGTPSLPPRDVPCLG